MRRVALQLIARALGLRSACRPPVEQPANALDPYIATACQFCGAFAAALRSLRRGPFSLQSRYSARRRRALPGATPSAVSQLKEVALDEISVHEQQRLAPEQLLHEQQLPQAEKQEPPRPIFTSGIAAVRIQAMIRRWKCRLEFERHVRGLEAACARDEKAFLEAQEKSVEGT